MADYQHAAVTGETRGYVMIATINRPEARNTFDRSAREGVGDALTRKPINAIAPPGQPRAFVERRAPVSQAK